MQSFIKKFLIVSALIFPVLVFAAPGIPHQFYGVVTFANGVVAPGGTLIEAKINGETIAGCSVKDGKYGYRPILCFVTDPNDNRWQNGGEIIHFFVNGLDTEETVNFKKGASTRLDFSFPDVGSGEITGEIDSTTTVVVVPDSPTTIKTDDNNLNVSITSANSTNAVVKKVKKLEMSSFTGAMAVMSGSNLLNGYEIDITGDDIEISVTMKYDDTGIDEANIAPYKFDGTSWVAIEPFQQDTTLNTITFTIPSAATPYAIFGSTAQAAPTGGGTPSGGGGGGGSAAADTSAPSISNVNVDIGRTTATITWQTNESSISWISYGTTTDYGKEVKTASYSTSHSLKIENLSPGTIYHYQIKSKDSTGNEGQYTDKTFTTSAVQTKGDINDDGKVNKYDFALMMSDWGKTGLNISSDLNNDGKVDKYDFSLLMVSWSI